MPIDSHSMHTKSASWVVILSAKGFWPPRRREWSF